VADEAQAAALVARTVTSFGRLDMDYNNAGIVGPMCPMMEETAEGFDHVNAVNLRGVWTCMKHELLQMKQQGNGAIVNCSSLGGLVGLPGRAAYHATKHGVIGLTKSAASWCFATRRCSQHVTHLPRAPPFSHVADLCRRRDEAKLAWRRSALRRCGHPYRRAR
jgi:NAD(P)-dependent dehydrogenase (short-subunit alcohol dehydrogenase family)